MRLREIKSTNLLIIKMNGVDLQFDNEYELIVDAHSFMKNAMIGPNSHRILLNNISDFEIRIEKFFGIHFFPDCDINNIKIKLRRYRKHLDVIRNEIP